MNSTGKSFLTKSRPSEELLKLFRDTKSHERSDDEYHEQRISFAWGNAMDESVTKESVRRAARLDLKSD